MAAKHGLKAQQVQAQGNALGYVKPELRPVRAKVINNHSPILCPFALTGRRCLCTDTQGVALGYELAALSGRVFKIDFLARLFFSLYPLILYGLQLNAVAISKRDSFLLLTIK